MSFERFKISEKEQEMVDRLQERWGFDKRAEFWRFALRWLYRDTFPPYKQPTEKSPQPETDPIKLMSDEQYCTEFLGGEVIPGDDGPACRWQKGSGEFTVPLKQIKNFT